MTEWEKRQLFSKATELKYKLEHPQTHDKAELNKLNREYLETKGLINASRQLSAEYADAQQIF